MLLIRKYEREAIKLRRNSKIVTAGLLLAKRDDVVRQIIRKVDEIISVESRGSGKDVNILTERMAIEFLREALCFELVFDLTDKSPFDELVHVSVNQILRDHQLEADEVRDFVKLEVFRRFFDRVTKNIGAKLQEYDQKEYDRKNPVVLEQ
jgi:hypothetical protein